jgi:hypothetical protein
MHWDDWFDHHQLLELNGGHNHVDGVRAHVAAVGEVEQRSVPRPGDTGAAANPAGAPAISHFGGGNNPSQNAISTDQRAVVPTEVTIETGQERSPNR